MTTKATSNIESIKLMKKAKSAIIVAILTLMFSACASQQADVQKAEVKKVQPVELSCEQLEAQRKAEAKNPPKVALTDPSKAAAKKEPEKPQYGISYGRCLPRGVIEISENFPIKPDVRAKFLEASSLLEQKNYDQAIMLLKGVVGQSDQFSAPFINLGIAYARKDDLKNAEVNLQKAREINPRHPVALNELGLIYRKTGRYVEARQLYEELIKLYPDYLPARKNLAVLCDIYIQDLACALSQYEEYLVGEPTDEKVKIWVADVKSRMK